MLAALADDVVTAAIHLKLLRDLDRSVKKYFRAFNQSTAFWNLTFKAHNHTAMITLCRVWDSHADTVNVNNLVTVAADHPEWFSEAEFRVRKQGNPYVDSLAKANRTPDRKKLRYHMRLCKSPLVGRLQGWRHTAVAHLSTSRALNPEGLVRRFPVSIRDLQTLTNRAARIVNYYTDLFSAGVYSTRMFSDDDYMKVLEAVEDGIRHRRTQYKQELRQAGLTPKGTPLKRRRG